MNHQEISPIFKVFSILTISFFNKILQFKRFFLLSGGKYIKNYVPFTNSLSFQLSDKQLFSF